MNVFCVDIGYSLKKDLEKWENNHMSYAGHILYGVNHMRENGIMPIFELGEHGYIYGKWYECLDEFIKAFSLFIKHREIDAIYIPHAYYSKWIVVLHKMRVIKAPVIVCLHNKNNLRGFLSACDKIVTINPYLYACLQEDYPERKNDIQFIPLAPEQIGVNKEDMKPEVDVISIGNTKRDFELLVKAMTGLPYTCKIISDKFEKMELPENVEVVHGQLSYEDCLKEYAKAKVIALPLSKDVEEGVFGLTSLVDALTVGKPVIVSKTKGIGIKIQELGCGIEVDGAMEMARAIQKLLENEEYREKIESRIAEVKLDFNMQKSSRKLCEIIKQMKK